MSSVSDQAEQELDVQVQQFLAVWFQVRQQVMELNFKRAHQQGLSTTQFMLLGLMHAAQDNVPCTIGWLASQLNLDPATVVRTVDSLEKRGWVERRRDSSDRRKVSVAMTEEGRAAQQQLHQRFTSRLTAILYAMSEEGRMALLRGLQEFASVAQQAAASDET
jgi:DNA-binding MarR family transcriptional regulator